ncbi:septum site-determining protein Ssd [Nocardioides alcanivorans]|uniref:septum site-determining protein Ssd n=1 Tax=Nocardioides alcanivorans TaxID=2897352 RepID=UPI001F3182CB|nr:septum site-determining protein Ssd [Nocardioides alcanivorans]
MDAPLVITRDRALADELVRLCAAAGATPAVVDDPTGALTAWADAAVVLVGLDMVEQVAAVGPPRRRSVHLVAREHVPDAAFRHAVTIGLEGVAELPRSDEWLLDVLADAAESELAQGLTIGVIGGSGGAGATTLACALGLVAAKQGSAALLDLDVRGPGLDVVLGTEGATGLQWTTLGQTTGRLGARSFREALPSRDGLGVVTWAPGPRRPLQPFAVREALAAATRGHDTVVLDLPRQGDELTEELLARCAHVVVVVRGDMPGLSSASRMVRHLTASGPVSCVLRGGGDVGDVERVLAVPLLGRIPEPRGLVEDIDLGHGPLRSRRSTLARAARTVLAELAVRVDGRAA